MNCEQTQSQLDDYIDGLLSPLQEELVSSHCATCQSCAQSLKSRRMQKQVLRSLPVPATSDGFSNRVIKDALSAAEAGQQPGGQPRVRHSSFYKFATAAMLSAIVLWLGFFSERQSTDNELYMVTVDNEVRTVKVAIDSTQSIDAVSMHVELSDNLELSGFGNKKQISWTTGLSEGVNVISLPIIGIAQGKGDITTRVRLNGKEKVMRIKTQYKAPGNVLYESHTVLQG